MISIFWFIVYLGIISCVIYLYCHLNVYERLFPKQFVFKSEELKKLVMEVMKEVPGDSDGEKLVPLRGDPIHPKDEGTPLSDHLGMRNVIVRRLALIHKKMYQKYPDYIRHPDEIDWTDADCLRKHFFLCVTGGAIGQVMFLHFSANEYIMIFGSPLGTIGHSGRYLYHIRDYILTGHHKTYLEGDLHGQSFLPGQMTVLPKGEGVIYKSDEMTYMLEHGRGHGLLVAALYPLMSTLFTTLDFYSYYRQIIVVSKLLFRSLKRGKF